MTTENSPSQKLYSPRNYIPPEDEALNEAGLEPSATKMAQSLRPYELLRLLRRDSDHYRFRS